MTGTFMGLLGFWGGIVFFDFTYCYYCNQGKTYYKIIYRICNFDDIICFKYFFAKQLEYPKNSGKISGGNIR